MPIPDEHIFPHATGAALHTVNQHQHPQDLVFYAGWFCPFVQRTWIVLEERSIPYQYKEVNPYKKEQHFLDINPKGLVPAVEYAGHALYESLVLNEFLEDAFPAHAPALLPRDPLARARARLWIDHISKSVVPPFFRLLQAQDPATRAAARAELYAGLRALAAQAAGPYFFGAEFGLVDAALAPWAVRDYLVAQHRGYERAGAGSAWEAYARALETRKSVLDTQSDKEHYEEIYGRYLSDSAQSEAAKATREGKVIP